MSSQVFFLSAEQQEPFGLQLVSRFLLLREENSAMLRAVETNSFAQYLNMVRMKLKQTVNFNTGYILYL